MYRIYVVELAAEATTAPGPSGVVYVAETSKSPEDRFELDRAGGMLASATVAHFGVCLRPDLTPQRTYATRADALGAARRTRRRLEKKGYTVIGGAGRMIVGADPLPRSAKLA